MNIGLDFLGNINSKNLLTLLISVGIAFIVALWIGIILWVLRDIRSRSRDPLLAILSVLLVIVLFIPGIFVYLILRPKKTFEQKYMEALEEESLLREIGISEKCPSCGSDIEKDWIVCRYCHTKLKKKCVSCGAALELPWNICPRCGEQQQKPYVSEK